jgi:2-dehydropantoate 2-reductase
MKVAVLGPGAMGSIFAAMFVQAGHSVTLIARGRRLSTLREKGLWMKQANRSVAYKVDDIEVLDELKANDYYDIVFVTVQRSQIEQVIPLLCASTCKKIVLMFNCASGASQWDEKLGAKRVFWGFPAALGEIIDGVTNYTLLPGYLRFAQITTLGRSRGPIDAPLKEIESLFHAAGLPAVCTDNMDAWLKTHAAFMAPLIASGYIREKCSGFQFSMRESKLVSTAIKECFEVLRRLGIRPVPFNMRLFGYVPLILFYPVLWLAFSNNFVKQALFGHAGHAATEAEILFDELEDLASKTKFQMLAMKKLRSYIPPEKRNKT